MSLVLLLGSAGRCGHSLFRGMVEGKIKSVPLVTASHMVEARVSEKALKGHVTKGGHRQVKIWATLVTGRTTYATTCPTAPEMRGHQGKRERIPILTDLKHKMAARSQIYPSSPAIY